MYITGYVVIKTVNIMDSKKLNHHQIQEFHKEWMLVQGRDFLSWSEVAKLE